MTPVRFRLSSTSARTRRSYRPQRVAWAPWQFSGVDYVDALGRIRSLDARAEALAELNGPPVETPWDPALGAAMVEHGVRVEEELLLDDLIADLA
ncbi:DUF2399 domain-containing protein [Phytoactinopolyspora endophytica]|uniref:DUF2399 domain-containing protein n=1 Tax=Phytoactinopolyspora endophytica TaxID=1642495 RepID=UPI00101D0BB1|nr:DUF2399 domain-containing protein [Phytoactinopolyspora endophytica]